MKRVIAVCGVLLLSQPAFAQNEQIVEPVPVVQNEQAIDPAAPVVAAVKECMLTPEGFSGIKWDEKFENLASYNFQENAQAKNGKEIFYRIDGEECVWGPITLSGITYGFAEGAFKTISASIAGEDAKEALKGLFTASFAKDPEIREETAEMYSWADGSVQVILNFNQLTKKSFFTIRHVKTTL